MVFGKEQQPGQTKPTTAELPEIPDIDDGISSGPLELYERGVAQKNESLTTEATKKPLADSEQAAQMTISESFLNPDGRNTQFPMEGNTAFKPMRGPSRRLIIDIRDAIGINPAAGAYVGTRNLPGQTPPN
jgi:hypothetical protein